jgi:hypothetical protein
LESERRKKAREAKYETNLRVDDAANEEERSELEQNRRLNQTQERTESIPFGRFTDYMCSTWDPNTFEQSVKYDDAGPWWLGREGYEKLTTQWFELDEEGRQRIAAIEADIAQEREPLSPKIRSRDASPGTQYSCSCGADCRIEEKPKMMKGMYPEDGPTNEERDDAYRAERLDRAHERFTSKVRTILENFEYRADRGQEIGRKEEECLREILALAKGKKRDEILLNKLIVKNQSTKTANLLQI